MIRTQPRRRSGVREASAIKRPSSRARRHWKLGLVVGGIALLTSCRADPGFNGRGSREWVVMLGDSSQIVRVQAADALARILRIQPNSPEIVQALIRALGDDDDAVRMAASTALVTRGVLAEGAIPAVHEALHDSAHATVRAHAALILGSLGSRAAGPAVPALTEALTDPESFVRGSAAEALGKIGPAASTAVPQLRYLANDPDALARLKAIEALLNIRPDPSTTIPVFKRALRDSSVALRAAAAYALSDLGPFAASATGALAEALGDREATVRAAAAFALARIGAGAEVALPALAELRDDADPRVRSFAADAISRIRGAPGSRRGSPSGH